MPKPAVLKKASDFMPLDDPKFLLHHHLTCKERARPTLTLHASEVTKEGDEEFCPRYYALHDVLKRKGQPDKFMSTSDAVLFGIGHGLQASMVTWFGEMDRVWAMGVCRLRV